jgi:FkbM family methyltransferase
MQYLKSFIKRLLLRRNLWICRYDSAMNYFYRRQLLFNAFGVDHVLDVGANTGGYAREIRQWGYSGSILSFEPVKSTFEELRRSAQGDSTWKCIHGALGDTTGKQSINVLEDSRSSSFLPTSQRLQAVIPGATLSRTEETQVWRLDNVAGRLPDNRTVFLKMDTQGFEKPILDGASQTLPLITGIQAEIPLTHDAAYTEDQPLAAYFIQRMQDLGFDLLSVEPGYWNKETGQLYQADFLFFRQRA